MKKISIIIAAALAMVFAGCEAQEQPVERKLVSKTFSVSMPDTRTALDGMSIKWGTADEINVIGITASGTITEHTFSIQSGAGTSSATFAGEVNDDETTFYALYPNLPIDQGKYTSNSRINLKENLATTRKAVKDGFDPAAAVMVAKESGGAFAFVHLMAYLKLQVGVADVASVKITSSGCKGLNGKANITTDLATVSVDGSTTYDIVLAPDSGTLVQNGIYYIPVCVKASDLKTVTVEYTFSDSSTAYLATTGLNSTKLSAGKVFDLGNPPIVKPTGPSITLLKTSVSDIEPDAATALQIASAYTIVNGTDSDITVTTDGTVVVSASVSGGTVTYGISENTGTSRKGWIGLQAGSEEVKKIEVNQKASAAIVLTNITTTTTWGSTDWAAIATAYSCDGTALAQDFIFNNLGFVNGSGSGYKIETSKGQIQLAGTGAAGTKCCIQFKAGGPGKVTITCRSANKSSARNLNVAIGDSDKGQITAPGYQGNDPVTKTINLPDAVAGNMINIYSANSGICIFEITWTPTILDGTL